MFLEVSEAGLAIDIAGEQHVREARIEDVDALTRLEDEIMGIRRADDLRYLIENHGGFWHVSVFENGRGEIQGFLASSAHPGCNMLGPGAAETSRQAAALLLAELKGHPGRTPGFLIPTQCDDSVASSCTGFGHLDSVLGICLGFRISCFGFITCRYSHHRPRSFRLLAA